MDLWINFRDYIPWLCPAKLSCIYYPLGKSALRMEINIHDRNSWCLKLCYLKQSLRQKFNCTRALRKCSSGKTCNEEINAT